MINLGDPTKPCDCRILRFLSLFLTGKLSVNEAKEKAREEFGDIMSENIERSVDELYSVAKDMLDNAKSEGKAEGLAEGKAKGLAEGRAEGESVGEARGLAKGIAKGKMIGYFDLILHGLLKIEDAASVLSMSIETFKEQMRDYTASQGVAFSG